MHYTGNGPKSAQAGQEAPEPRRWQAGRRGWYWIDRRALLKKGAEVGPYGIAAYNALALRADAEGRCWPGAEDVARVTGMSAKQARRSLAALARAGLVESYPRHDEAGRRLSNGYQLLEVGGWTGRPGGGTRGAGGLDSEGAPGWSVSPPNESKGNENQGTSARARARNPHGREPDGWFD